MGIKGNGSKPAEAANPAYIVTVRDFAPETLAAIAAQLEVSTDFEHLVYREAELDAIWSITGFAISQAQVGRPLPPANQDVGQALPPADQELVARLHAAAHRAHDLVGEGRPREAAALLRKFL